MKIIMSRHKYRFHPYSKHLKPRHKPIFYVKKAWRKLPEKLSGFNIPFVPSIHNSLVNTSFFHGEVKNNSIPLCTDTRFVTQCNRFLDSFLPKSLPSSNEANPKSFQQCSSTLMQPIPSNPVPAKETSFVSNGSPIPLEEHQLAACNFLFQKYNTRHSDYTIAVLLNMSMGCGKTRIVLEFLSFIKSIHFPLFFTKPSIQSHIQSEICKWTPSLQIQLLSPKSFLASDEKRIHPSCVIVMDECHILTHSKKSKFMQKLFKEISQIPVFIVLLSGTPGDPSKPLSYFNSTEQDFSEFVFSFVWKPSQVVSSVQSLSLTSEQNTIYQNFRESFLACSGKEKMYLLHRMRKLISQWKLPYVTKLVEYYVSKAAFVLVVSQFGNVLMELDMLLPVSIQRRRIDAHVGMQQRDSYVREFQTGTLPVLLGTEDAIGHGIDLWKANLLLFIEPNFSADEQKQTTNRLTRLGAENPNQTIITLAFDQTVEKRLFEANFSTVG